MAVQGSKKQSFMSRNIPLIAAFLAPILLLLVIYIAREIFPFGEEMYLRSDMYHQYAPFLKLFQTTLKEGGSLSYSWNIGLGTNFMSTYAYYLSSPLNWLLAVLPSDSIPEILSSFIFLKSGLMSAFCAFYLREHFKTNTLLTAGFGTLYAMSGYMAAYSWNVMWLDCLVLLPLLVLGLERLVRERKVVLYTVTFALAVISNYYIAIMLAIFSFLYFLYLMISEAVHKNASDVLRKTGRYFLYSVLGGLIGAVVFLPAFLTLFGTASADSSFPSRLSAYFNLLELFAHGMINAKVTMMDGYLPNIYAGTAVFALVPLFWLNPKIPVRERVGKTVLMGIFLFSFSFNVPAFIWHGFHFPNSLPSRQSFIYVFLILAIGFEAVLKAKEVSIKRLLLSFGGAMAAVFALQVLFDGEDYPSSMAWISAGFLLLYLILILLYRSPKKAASFAGAVFFTAAMFTEAAINTDATGYGTTSRTAYFSDNEAIDSVLSRIKDTDFYRVEKIKRRTKNDGAWSGYPSASIFSSVTTQALSRFYKAFGLQSGTNSFSWYGNTPLSSAILGVRYQLSDKEESLDFREFITEEEGIRLYKSRDTLPLGFMVKETLQAEINLTEEDPFEVQNDFLDAAKDLPPVFHEEYELEGDAIEYTASSEGHLFFRVDRRLKTLTITKSGNSQSGAESFTSNPEGPMIVYAGKVARGETVNLTFTDENEEHFRATPAIFDESAFRRAIRELGEEPFLVTDFSDTFVKGEVQAKEGGMLFTSIPYDGGWTAFVDGEETEIKDFYGAFIQLPISSGTHQVEFRYRVPGLLPGALISGVALILFVILAAFHEKKRKEDLKKRKQEKKSPADDNVSDYKEPEGLKESSGLAPVREGKDASAQSASSESFHGEAVIPESSAVTPRILDESLQASARSASSPKALKEGSELSTRQLSSPRELNESAELASTKITPRKYPAPRKAAPRTFD